MNYCERNGTWEKIDISDHIGSLFGNTECYRYFKNMGRNFDEKMHKNSFFCSFIFSSFLETGGTCTGGSYMEKIGTCGSGEWKPYLSCLFVQG